LARRKGGNGGVELYGFAKICLRWGEKSLHGEHLSVKANWFPEREEKAG